MSSGRGARCATPKPQPSEANSFSGVSQRPTLLATPATILTEHQVSPAHPEEGDGVGDGRLFRLAAHLSRIRSLSSACWGPLLPGCLVVSFPGTPSVRVPTKPRPFRSEAAYPHQSPRVASTEFPRILRVPAYPQQSTRVSSTESRSGACVATPFRSTPHGTPEPNAVIRGPRVHSGPPTLYFPLNNHHHTHGHK